MITITLKIKGMENFFINKLTATSFKSGLKNEK